MTTWKRWAGSGVLLAVALVGGTVAFGLDKKEVAGGVILAVAIWALLRLNGIRIVVGGDSKVKLGPVEVPLHIQRTLENSRTELEEADQVVAIAEERLREQDAVLVASYDEIIRLRNENRRLREHLAALDPEFDGKD